MKLEKQVASLELSKELVELGLKVDSLFVWRKIPSPLMNKPSDHKTVQWTGPKPKPDDVPAYTAVELGEMLPNGVRITKINTKWMVTTLDCHHSIEINRIYDVSLVDTMVRLLMRLIKENQVTVDELNNV